MTAIANRPAGRKGAFFLSSAYCCNFSVVCVAWIFVQLWHMEEGGRQGRRERRLEGGKV
jgi:hypothetical protein